MPHTEKHIEPPCAGQFGKFSPMTRLFFQNQDRHAVRDVPNCDDFETDFIDYLRRLADHGPASKDGKAVNAA